MCEQLNDLYVVTVRETRSTLLSQPDLDKVNGRFENERNRNDAERSRKRVVSTLQPKPYYDILLF